MLRSSRTRLVSKLISLKIIGGRSTFVGKKTDCKSLYVHNANTLNSTIQSTCFDKLDPSLFEFNSSTQSKPCLKSNNEDNEDTYETVTSLLNTVDRVTAFLKVFKYFGINIKRQTPSTKFTKFVRFDKTMEGIRMYGAVGERRFLEFFCALFYHMEPEDVKYRDELLTKKKVAAIAAMIDNIVSINNFDRNNTPMALLRVWAREREYFVEDFAHEINCWFGGTYEGYFNDSEKYLSGKTYDDYAITHYKVIFFLDVFNFFGINIKRKTPTIKATKFVRFDTTMKREYGAVGEHRFLEFFCAMFYHMEPDDIKLRNHLLSEEKVAAVGEMIDNIVAINNFDRNNTPLTLLKKWSQESEYINGLNFATRLNNWYGGCFDGFEDCEEL